MKKINLTIPKPCHENWDQMSDVQKRKFCNACQKVVIDFTNMSDRELANFFKKTTGSVCGKFKDDQLNRDIAIPRKKIPWVKYFFQFTLPAFLMTLKSCGLKQDVMGKIAVTNTRTMGEPALSITDSSKQIQIGSPVLKKSNKVEIKENYVINDSHLEKRVKTITDFNLPEFSVYPVQNIQAYYSPLLAFPTHSLTCRIGGIMVTSTKNKHSESIPLLKKLFDTAFQHFTVCPNPVKADTLLTINMNKMNLGTYDISIINSNGQLIQNTEEITDVKIQTIKVQLNNMTSGSYFVRLTNKQSGKAYTEKIMVE
jgi:hypothetical protein